MWGCVLMIMHLFHSCRDFLVDELVKSIDALSREQFRSLVTAVGLQNLQVRPSSSTKYAWERWQVLPLCSCLVPAASCTASLACMCNISSEYTKRLAACVVQSVQVPQLLPGSRGTVPLAPRITREDERVIANVAIISNFLAGALLLRSPVCHLTHCAGCWTSRWHFPQPRCLCSQPSPCQGTAHKPEAHSLLAATGGTGSQGADEGARTSAMLPGGRTATNPAGDMRALATSLPALVRFEHSQAVLRAWTPSQTCCLC